MLSKEICKKCKQATKLEGKEWAEGPEGSVRLWDDHRGVSCPALPPFGCVRASSDIPTSCQYKLEQLLAADFVNVDKNK